MSAVRAAAATKHTRALSQPFRRTFYSPFAALQHSPLLSKPPAVGEAPSAATATTHAHAHEHEHEHTTRTLHVVSQPNAVDVKYGVPVGAYPNATPYHPVAHAALENVSPRLDRLFRCTSRAYTLPAKHTACVGDEGALHMILLCSPGSALAGEGGLDLGKRIVTWLVGEGSRSATAHPPLTQQRGEEIWPRRSIEA